MTRTVARARLAASLIKPAGVYRDLRSSGRFKISFLKIPRFPAPHFLLISAKEVTLTWPLHSPSIFT
jgi:hypothetical protein